MPVGKNSLKRVTNSGYSNVKTNAPDMENSTVAEEPKVNAPKAEASIAKKSVGKAPVSKKAAPKKPTAKPTAKKAELKPATETAPITKESASSNSKISIGDAMPVYLL